MTDHVPQLAHLEYLGDASRFAQQIHALIPKSALLENFTPGEVRMLSHFMDVYRAAEGQEVIHEGDGGDFMLLVVEGRGHQQLGVVRLVLVAVGVEVVAGHDLPGHRHVRRIVAEHRQLDLAARDLLLHHDPLVVRQREVDGLRELGARSPSVWARDGVPVSPTETKRVPSGANWRSPAFWRSPYHESISVRYSSTNGICQ